jgi:hypothetical protein
MPRTRGPGAKPGSFARPGNGLCQPPANGLLREGCNSKGASTSRNWRFRAHDAGKFT